MGLHTFHIWTLIRAILSCRAFLSLTDERIPDILLGAVTKISDTIIVVPGTITVVPAQTAQIFLSVGEAEKTDDNENQSLIFLHFNSLSCIRNLIQYMI